MTPGTNTSLNLSVKKIKRGPCCMWVHVSMVVTGTEKSLLFSLGALCRSLLLLNGRSTE